MMKKRCGWCTADPIYIEYHDKEWGRPVHEDRLLFEFLILEGAQAGLSWLTVLKKRDHYRKAFNNFDALKIASAIGNARAFLEVQKECGTFDKYIWQFVDAKTVKNNISHFKKLPTN